MMSLDEAIKHAEEVAEENQAIVDSCDYYGENMAKCEKCAEEHRQLAEWLKELKELRGKYASLRGKYARLRRECNEVIDEICRLRGQRMTENEKIDFLVNSIKGDINRMCATNELSEFDAMYGRSKHSLDMLSKMIHERRFK